MPPNDDDAPLAETEWLHVAGRHVDAIARALYDRVQVLTEQRNRLLWAIELDRVRDEALRGGEDYWITEVPVSCDPAGEGSAL
jgi:hypothetical protein